MKPGNFEVDARLRLGAFEEERAIDMKGPCLRKEVNQNGRIAPLLLTVNHY